MKDYFFTGEHAKKVKELTGSLDENNAKIFERNVDIYLIAPLIGFNYQVKSPIKLNTNAREERVAINASQVIQNADARLFNYRLIMLLDENNEPEFESRINKAFREYVDPLESDNELYESYLRGGIDILYDKIIKNASDKDSYLLNLYDFLEEFNHDFMNGLNDDEFNKKLLSMAKV